MDALGMVDFTTQPKAVNGAFGVPKDGGVSTRLIIDARPANYLFKSPPPVRLPTPDVLARVRVPSSRPFFTAKVDIDNFYHRLRCPEWLRPYFALPAVRASDVSVAVAARFGPDALVHPMCATLPMGWSHSVFVAQSAHEWLLDRATALRPCDRLGCERFSGDYCLRARRVLHSVYIDDVALFGLERARVARVQRQYMDVACAHGLAVKASKVCAPTSQPVEVLGLEVRGVEHTVALSAAKLDALCADTSSLVRAFMQCETRIADGVSGPMSSRGVECTGLQLAHLVGRWTWAMLVNRPALAVFSAVYRYIETARERASFVLWPSAALELAVAMALAPLLSVHLAARTYPSFIATDASEFGQGVVAFTPARPDTRLAPPREYLSSLPASPFSSPSLSGSLSASSSAAISSPPLCPVCPLPVLGAVVRARSVSAVGLQSAAECVSRCDDSVSSGSSGSVCAVGPSGVSRGGCALVHDRGRALAAR